MHRPAAVAAAAADTAARNAEAAEAAKLVGREYPPLRPDDNAASRARLGGSIWILRKVVPVDRLEGQDEEGVGGEGGPGTPPSPLLRFATTAELIAQSGFASYDHLDNPAYLAAFRAAREGAAVQGALAGGAL
jgi:hypothetical protein